MLPIRLEAKRSVVIAMGVILLIAIALGANSWRVIRNANQAAGLVTRTVEVRQQVSLLTSTFLQAESSRREYILDSDAASLRRFSEAVVQLEPLIAQLRVMTSSNSEQQRRLDELELLIQERKKDLERSVQKWKSGAHDMDAWRVYTSKYVTLTDHICEYLRNFDEDEMHLLSKQSLRAKAEQDYALWLIVSGTVLVCLLLILAFAALNRELLRRWRLEQELAKHRDSLKEDVATQAASVRTANERLTVRGASS
jgi:CHASE3 domain sensor protein